jgi:hypothetical protein
MSEPHTLSLSILINRDGSHEIVYTQLGGFSEPEPFLGAILEAYGVKPKDPQGIMRDPATSLMN